MQIFYCFLNFFSFSLCPFLCFLKIRVNFLKCRMKESRQERFSEFYFTVLDYFDASVIVSFETSLPLFTSLLKLLQFGHISVNKLSIPTLSNLSPIILSIYVIFSKSASNFAVFHRLLNVFSV